MRTQIREVKYKSSQYMRVLLYPVRSKGGRRPGRRRSRGKPTSAIQAALNARNAARLLSDLIHLNFTPDDCAIHPTYADGFMPSTDEEAQKKNYKLYPPRSPRLYKKERKLRGLQIYIRYRKDKKGEISPSSDLFGSRRYIQRNDRVLGNGSLQSASP